MLRRMLVHMRCGVFKATLHSSVIEGIWFRVRRLLLLLQGCLCCTRRFVLWRDTVCDALQETSIHGVCDCAVAIGRRRLHVATFLFASTSLSFVTVGAWRIVRGHDVDEEMLEQSTVLVLSRLRRVAISLAIMFTRYQVKMWIFVSKEVAYAISD